MEMDCAGVTCRGPTPGSPLTPCVSLSPHLPGGDWRDCLESSASLSPTMQHGGTLDQAALSIGYDTPKTYHQYCNSATSSGYLTKDNFIPESEDFFGWLDQPNAPLQPECDENCWSSTSYTQNSNTSYSCGSDSSAELSGTPNSSHGQTGNMALPLIQNMYDNGSTNENFIYEGATTVLTSGTWRGDCADSSQFAHGHQNRRGQKSKRKRVINRVQRVAANQRERKRMLTMNEAFDVLKEKIPVLSEDKKVSRIDTLRLAISYIKFMSDIVNGKSPEVDTANLGKMLEGL